jgi:GNAT superfamily N-acetyltransferase
MSAVIMDIHACTDLDPATITGANGEPAETALYLKTLGVREEARRHGCALELVNACELYAKQVSQRLTG